MIIGAGFKETKLYPEFQIRIHAFAKTVANSVRDAPDYTDWPVASQTPDPEIPDVPQQRL